MHPGTAIKLLLKATSLQRTKVEMHLAVLYNNRIINCWSHLAGKWGDYAEKVTAVEIEMFLLQDTGDACLEYSLSFDYLCPRSINSNQKNYIKSLPGE